jgi:thiosulfate reductase cytochrome b subunit
VRPRGNYVYRHSRIVRVTHWLNAVAVFLLLMTGFGITQLYTPLHWGDAGQDWGDVGQELNGPGGDAYPAIAKVPDIPSQLHLGRSVDDALRSAGAYLRTPMRVRDHIFFAWLFLFNGLVYLAARMFTDEARSYRLIQKYAYLFIIFVALPLQLLTGLALLPWMDAAFPWLKDLFFGRQSARTLHFSGSLLILAFVIVHLAMVVLSGFRNNMRSMVTGWYKLPSDR